ncbi:Autolysin [Escovopsis weberi]|uniref:Autolysin n=1 Tax=Escovopsis weberi TaxID=150374 RepID=A0A0M8NA18_ESCWE|nr:Autolysin [Escovopsis weberi]
METCDYIEQETGITHQDFVAWNPSLKEDCSGINEGIVENCNRWYKASPGDTCDAISKKGGFTLKQFAAWNLAVGEDCSGLWAHFYYCTSVPGFTPSMTTTTTRTTPRSPTSDISAPTKTQQGIIDTCNQWAQAKSGDNCDGIARKYGISSKDFKDWNPAVQDDCSGLWANYYYCVSIPGRGSGPVPTPQPKPTPTKPSGPRTQDGIVADCQTLYTAKKGDSCSSIVSQYGNLDLATFVKWNPAVGEDCYNLWANYGYCVGTKDKPASSPHASPSPSPPPESKPPTGCSKPHPEPTQPGALCECNKWYKVSRGDGCWSIAQKFGVTEDDIRRWNPESDCQLWLNYNVCVSA